MAIYIVYDKESGEIVHTATFHVLGSDDAVSASEDEVLALAADESGRAASGLAVTRAPDSFDPRDRTKTLKVDPAKGACMVADRAAPRASAAN